MPEDSTVSLEEVVLYADVANQFEFGATVVVLASNDSLTFDSLAMANGTAPAADTLLSLELLPNENTDPLVMPGVREIVLSHSKLSLFENKLYLKPQVQLLGRVDADGNSVPSRFFTTDSLAIKSWGSISYTVHGEDL